jgi:murein DD-endopeptidase MepM/ murein hydrolase activator NlpD
MTYKRNGLVKFSRITACIFEEFSTRRDWFMSGFFARLEKLSLYTSQYTDMPDLFRHAFRDLLRHPWILGGLGSVTLLGMVTASAIVSKTDDTPAPVRTVFLEHIALPVAVPVDSDADKAEFVREESVRRSDTLSSLLSRLGIDDPGALAFISHNPDAKDIARQLRPGKTVTAKTRLDGRLAAFYFPINGKDSLLVVERKDGGFNVSEQVRQLTPRIHFNSGEIVSSLFGATDKADIPDAIATQLADIFSSDIDFYRDLRKGDKFSVVYESLTNNGQSIRSGRILAAEFINNNKTFQAYWFETEEGKSGYYDSGGQSLRKTFLRSPLEFSRITSGFSNSRFNPVLLVNRAHKGIDYGAPTGTRIRAVADGAVEIADYQEGYGNLVVLRHQGQYSTAYGHMNGFAPGIHKGARVNQGDTIGFVGQTGRATGPHLHYEFRVNGQQVNPMSVSLPDASPLDSAQLSNFRTTIDPMRVHLDLAKQIQLTSIE